MINTDWTRLPDDETVQRVAKSLTERGMQAIVVNNGEEAKNKLFELIPKGSDVLGNTSKTLDTIGVTKELDQGTTYNSLRKAFQSISDPEERIRARKSACIAKYSVGSVHAITESGEVAVASATGSQLASYVYGAENVIWVVGAQKIVKDLDEARKRIYEHSLPLESERVRKAYGAERSNVNKILIFEGERQNRIKIILVKENLGF